MSLATGGGFIAAAVALVALSPPAQTPSALWAALLVGLHAIASRVEFDVGPGSVVPTQLVLVPMLFVLPPSVVPLAVAASYLLGGLWDHVTGKAHRDRSLVLLTYCWHALGPALVLTAFHPGAPSWRSWPVYAGALGAQFVFDFVSGSVRERLAFGVSVRDLVPVFRWVYAVDLLLTPVAFVVALLAVRETPLAATVAVPLLALLALLARERRERIERALRFDEAYRGATLEARSDALTGLGNRLAWEEALAGAQATPERPVSVILIDLDGLKVANDTRGHECGDELIRAVASAVRANVRDGDLVARIGGDEIGVLMLETGTDACGEMVERLSDVIGRHPPVSGLRLSATLGHATSPPERDLGLARRAADMRMYASKHRVRLATANEQMRDVLVTALGRRDPALAARGERVATLAVSLGARLRMSVDELDELRAAAELYDVGKIAVPDSILDKPEPLTDEERALVRSQPEVGERILAAVPALAAVAKIVRAVRERYDGGGYPDGLAGEAIPVAARILAVADAFDAMTSERPYRKRPHAPSEALDGLLRCSGTQFDRRIVEELCRVVARRAADRRAGGTAPTPPPGAEAEWARQDSNLGPTDYESAALTS